MDLESELFGIKLCLFFVFAVWCWVSPYPLWTGLFICRQREGNDSHFMCLWKNKKRETMRKFPSFLSPGFYSYFILVNYVPLGKSVSTLVKWGAMSSCLTPHLLGRCVCCMCSQSCLTLWDPMDCSPPGSSVHGIFQARILEWAAISYFRGSSQLRSNPHLLCLLHWQAGSLPVCHLGRPKPLHMEIFKMKDN